MTATITALVARVAMDTSAVSAGSAAVRKEAATVGRVFRDMETDTDKLEKKAAAVHRQYERGAITFNDYTKALEFLQNKFIKAPEAARKAAEETNRLKMQQQQAAEAARKLAAGVDSLKKSIDADDAAMRKQAQSLRAIKKESASVASSNSTLASSFRNIAAAYLSFQGIKAGIAIASDVQQATIAFEVMTGSAERGKQMLGELRQFAASTPITLSGAQQSAKTLLAFGVEAEKVIPTLKMLGDVSGGNSERFASLSLAFAQIQSAGRLMGQDLLQLINAGFNPLQVISEQTGRSMAQLKKDMEAGAISSDMVTKAFESASGEGGRFFGMMDRMSKTAMGSYNQLLSTIQEIVATAGETFLPILARVAKSLDNVLKSARNLAGGLNETQVKMMAGVAAFSATLMIIPRIIAAFKAIVVATKAMTAAQITALAFSGPKGWAQLAAGAAVAAATVYAVGSAFDGYADSVGKAQEQTEGLAAASDKLAASDGRRKKQLDPLTKSYEKMKHEIGEATKLARLGEDTYRQQTMRANGFADQQIRTIQHMHDALKLARQERIDREKAAEKRIKEAEELKAKMDALAAKGKTLMERNNPVLAVGKQLSELQVLLRVNAIDQKTFFKERNKILKESISGGGELIDASAIEVGSAEFVKQMASQFNEETNAQINKLEQQRLLQEAQLVAQKETNRRLQEMGITKRIQS
jgi:tape measure domain-containing protein